MNKFRLSLGFLFVGAVLFAAGTSASAAEVAAAAGPDAASSAAADPGTPPPGDAKRGRTLAYTCLGCHGVANYENAYPMYRVPKLAGQHPDYIVAALQGYRDGDRAHATMHAQASSMTDTDMRDIAAYLSTAAPSLSAATAAEPRGAAPAAGQVCTACHGANGVAIADQFPSLAGQYEDYLRRALTEYRQGARKNAVMANFASQLKDEDVAELAAYYSRQSAVVGTLARPWSILASK